MMIKSPSNNMTLNDSDANEMRSGHEARGHQNEII